MTYYRFIRAFTVSAPPAPGSDGEPIGLLLAITKTATAPTLPSAGQPLGLLLAITKAS